MSQNRYFCIFDYALGRRKTHPTTALASMSRHMERLAVHRTAGEGCLTEVVIFSKHIVTMNRAHRAAGLVVSMNRTEGRLTERRTEDRLTEAARIRT